MQEDRIQRVVSTDGTEIAARVEGQGPPLILLPAGPGDSETSWRPLLPLLSERFTCYLMDTRGRGASTNHPDHSPERLVEDVAEGRLTDAAEAFIEQSYVLYNDKERAHGAPSDSWQAAALNLPVFLQEQQQLSYLEAGPTSPTVLSRIEMPVLLLMATASRRWFIDSVHHVAEHLRDARVSQINGAGHFGPHTHPEAVAEEIIRFFTQYSQ